MQEMQWAAETGSFPGPRWSPAEEQTLLLPYLHLVRRVVGHLRSQVGTVLGRDDLEQIGLLGLLEALRRYGPPDEQFEYFAFKRIRGAILDELRRQDWRPRQLRQQANVFNQHSRALLNQLGRPPSEAELAASMAVPLATVRELGYASQAEAMHSFDELLEKLGGDWGGECEAQRMELQLTLQQLLASLDKRQQLLLSLYYQHELNMKEIALVLNLTESRVCQLHKQCLAHLNSRLAECL
ncbi:FliA/WhiG family RNA polymerase sigma factor [Pseudaeromonas sp. ZJS20]|uniref:FliA/WhiG family RNA polymerase sigma factor n=1 Tax=Pseudaeromonas aegiceratis TaxID=3153928 RepID=UPI00390CBCB0